MSKTNLFRQSAQHLIAGISKNDMGIEFYGFPETKTVEWIQNGHSHEFKELSPAHFSILATAFNTDFSARMILDELLDDKGERLNLSFKRKVELYTYYMYGGLDATPDLIDATLADSENYRHEKNCISLGFDKKKIRLRGVCLKRREIQMIDLMEEDLKDEVIAGEMNIAKSTYDQHKRALFNKTGLHTKTALMIQSVRDRVIKAFPKHQMA